MGNLKRIIVNKTYTWQYSYNKSSVYQYSPKSVAGHKIYELSFV
jgi:hypothetical protein